MCFEPSLRAVAQRSGRHDRGQRAARERGCPQAVGNGIRALVRFPADFMLQLTAEAFGALRTQSWTSGSRTPPGRGGRPTAPCAFADQGVAMLFSVLGSPRAIAVNIEMARTFVRVRALAATHGDVAKRLVELEEKTEALAMRLDTFSRDTRNQLRLFDALRELMTPPDPPKRPIGFINPEDKGSKNALGAPNKTLPQAPQTCCRKRRIRPAK